MARVIIHVHANGYFYWIMNILSQVSHLCPLITTLSNHNKMPRSLMFAGKYLPPFHEIFVQKIPIQKYFDITVLFANRFSKFLLYILRQTKCSIVPRKYFI